MGNAKQANDGAFSICFCAYGRISIDFANVLQSLQSDLQTPAAPSLKGLVDLNTLRDKTYQNAALRNFCALIISFCIGYRGIGQAMLPPYTSGVAGTVALLLTTDLSSGAVKGQARLVGVLLGQVLGQIAYVVLAWCWEPFRRLL